MIAGSAKPFLQSLNTTGSQWTQPNKPTGMKTQAPGINRSRWVIADQETETSVSGGRMHKNAQIEQFVMSIDVPLLANPICRYSKRLRQTLRNIFGIAGVFTMSQAR